MAAETVTWIDTTGTSHLLDGSTVNNPLAIAGRQGIFMPPIALLDQRTPLQPGTSIRFVDVQARPVALPLLVNCGNETTFHTLLDNMTGWFDPTLGDGTLRCTRPDGTQRDLFCRYVAGLDGDESYPNRFPGGIVLPLQLEAQDPYFYDTAYTVVTIPQNQQLPFLGTPFLPIHLGGSTFLGSMTINNTGRYETWPIWQIHGPGSNLQLFNNTSGKAIKLTANGGMSLAANEVLTIDTRFGIKTILKQDGSSQAGYLTNDSILFSLVTGNNDISVSMANSTSASVIQVTYKRRWWSM